jgi:hypothetical protein
MLSDGSYSFMEGEHEYTPKPEEIIRHRDSNSGIVYYYDGSTSKRIGPKNKLNYDLQLRTGDQKINMQGVATSGSGIVID